jgi:hypothetical protein
MPGKFDWESMKLVQKTSQWCYSDFNMEVNLNSWDQSTCWDIFGVPNK